jgi:hypothetical protein
MKSDAVGYFDMSVVPREDVIMLNSFQLTVRRPNAQEIVPSIKFPNIMSEDYIRYVGSKVKDTVVNAEVAALNKKIDALIDCVAALSAGKTSAEAAVAELKSELAEQAAPTLKSDDIEALRLELTAKHAPVRKERKAIYAHDCT